MPRLTIETSLDEILAAAGPAPEGYEAMPVNFGRSYSVGGGFKPDGLNAEGDWVYRWHEPRIVSPDSWRVFFVPSGWLSQCPA